MTLRQAVSVAWRTMFHGRRRLPLETLPQVRPDWEAFRAGGFRFMWFGHSTVALRVDDLTVLLDPVLSPTASPVSWLVPRFQPAASTPHELPQVDVVVISHDHYDHLDRALVRTLAAHQKTRFVVPTRVGKRLERWGVSADRITELGWDEFIQVSTVRFTATECHHSSRRGLFDGQSTLWASWAIHRGRPVGHAARRRNPVPPPQQRGHSPAVDLQGAARRGLGAVAVHAGPELRSGCSDSEGTAVGEHRRGPPRLHDCLNVG